MQRMLVTALMLMVASTVAFADGVSRRGKIAAPEQPAPQWLPPVQQANGPNWNGVYIGAHAPYHLDDYEGYGIGAQIGANVHFKSGLLLGLELDYTKAYLDREVLPLKYESALASRLDQYGSLRGRLGWAFGNVLVYGTGGYAIGFANFDIGDGNDTRRVEGLVYGGGSELKLSAMSIKAEYLKYEFNNKGTGNAEANLDQDVVRVGVNFPLTGLVGGW